jgi:hypothetical protein
MEIVQVAGIVFAAAVIVILAYLYRESAIIEGKAEWGIGPIKFSLGGRAQKRAEAKLPEAPAAPPGVRENVVIERSQIDTVKGVEVSKNLVAEDSSITVHDSDK